MKIGDVPAVDMPATPMPTTSTTATSKPAFPPAAPPPPVTTTTTTTRPASSSSGPHVQIKDPPAEEPREDRDRITLTLRQASEEAASKAKEATRAKLAQATAARMDVDQRSPSKTEPPERESAAEKSSRIEETKEEREKEHLPEAAPDTQVREGEPGGRRRSVVPAAEIERRPSVAETAAVSSANFRAENAETLGLVEHHRGSIVSATSPGEKESVSRDLRESLSGGTPAETAEEAKQAAEQGNARGQGQGQGGETTQKQDARAAEKAGASVED